MADLPSDRVDGGPSRPVIAALELPGRRALACQGHDLIRGDRHCTREAVLEPLVRVAGAAAVPVTS